MATPLYVDIERATLENPYYRRVIYTDAKMQVVLMTLGPQVEIGWEQHTKSSQFIRIEAGEGMAYIGMDKKAYPLKDGAAIVVPAGEYHNIVNTSSTGPLRLYTIYAEPQHVPNTLQPAKSA